MRPIYTAAAKLIVLSYPISWVSVKSPLFFITKTSASPKQIKRLAVGIRTVDPFKARVPLTPNSLESSSAAAPPAAANGRMANAARRHRPTSANAAPRGRRLAARYGSCVHSTSSRKTTAMNTSTCVIKTAHTGAAPENRRCNRCTAIPENVLYTSSTTAALQKRHASLTPSSSAAGFSSSLATDRSRRSSEEAIFLTL